MKMKLGTPYPMRFEKDFEAEVDALCEQLPLSKADILRMCCRAGYSAINWTKYQYQPLPNSAQTLAAQALNDAIADIAAAPAPVAASYRPAKKVARRSKSPAGRGMPSKT